MSNSITSQTPLPRPIPASEELGPLVGKTFGGYEITSYIGEGPTGAVYRAEDLVGTRMAVKVMHQELSRKEPAEKLWADLQKLSALADPRLLKIYDAGFGEDGQFYYAEDELIGCDLEAGLEESGALSPRKALEIVQQVCAALELAHGAGVVHGGLKPRNVFLTPSNHDLVVKVIDFGASRLAGGVDKGVIVGNPFYMAPEQFGGVAEPRTDVYALGVLMYELFSGTLPFAGTHGQVMMRHLSELPSPPPGVDADLGRIILRALSKTPAGRYQTIKQLREALDRWALTSPATLQDAAEFHVVARAADARAMKQAALSVPDATAQMPKIDVVELARATRPDGNAKNDTKKAGAADAGGNPNSSESVEASLEDFISQANASFPTATSDGWDLHTGDVELIDDGENDVESEEHVAKPVVVKPRKVEPVAAAPAVAKPVVVDNKDKSDPKKKTTTSKGIPVIAADPLAIKEPETEAPTFDSLPPPVTAQSRLPRPDASGRQERWAPESTDVISSPLPRMQTVPWTANPLVIIGGLLAAFIVGAGVVFMIVKNLAGPVVVPAPQVVVQTPPAVAAPAPAAAAPAPVVTPLPPPAATAPVVTPLPQQPQAAPPVAAVAPEPAQPRAPVSHAPKKKHAAESRKLSMPDEKPAKSAEKPAAAPKKEAPAKKESKGGGDWVDPFAQ